MKDHRELSLGQIRVLAYLDKQHHAISILRKNLAAIAFNGHSGQCSNALGPIEPAKRECAAARPGCRPGLLLLGYVNLVSMRRNPENADSPVEHFFQITPTGRNALAKALQELGDKGKEISDEMVSTVAREETAYRAAVARAKAGF
jgi:hypothetical protein